MSDAWSVFFLVLWVAVTIAIGEALNWWTNR